jgi:hypothetical protein
MRLSNCVHMVVCKGAGPWDVRRQSFAPAVACGDGAAVAVCVLCAHGVQAAGVAGGARDALDAVRVGVRLKLNDKSPGDCRRSFKAQMGLCAYGSVRLRPLSDEKV